MGFLRQLVLCFLIILGTAAFVRAHQYPDFDQTMGLTLDRDLFTLEYRIWYGPVLIPGLALDRNTDGILDEDELYAHLEDTHRRILEGLTLDLDGAPLDIRPLTATISTSGQYPKISLDVALWYSASAVRSPDARREMIIRDTNFASYGADRKLFFINTASRAGDIRVHRKGSDIRVTYTDGDAFGMSPGGSAGDSSRRGAAPSALNRAEDNRLTRFLQSGSTGPAMLFAAFATAFILGAGHALSPGHGKAMVAAYLVGTRGRKRDAVLLGLIVTFTHVISVIILGLVVLYLSTRILPEQIFPWISTASGILIFITGFLLLARNRPGHHHADGVHHDHGPSPGQGSPNPGPAAGSGPGIWSLLSMGIAGGMVPCPSALVVLLVSVSLHKIALGLAIIIVFSLGLAAVLVGIGVAVVSVSGFSSAVTRFAPVVRILPLFSAGLILILGIAITARGLIDAGLIRIIGM